MMYPLILPISSNKNIETQRGFSLIELMIAITLGLVVTLALLAIFENVTRTNREMAKNNEQIENGRFAIQILENDIKHAGFWGSYVPDFDDLTYSGVPTGTPTAIPDPCLAYSISNWDAAYQNNILGIPIQVYRNAPSNCSFLTNQKSNTDILVVRHADTCAVGETGCDALDANMIYFQSSLCVGTAQAGTANSITLSATTPTMSPAPSNSEFIRIISGTGAGQNRQVSTYTASTKVLTTGTAWTTSPDSSSIYTFGQTNYLLGPGSGSSSLRSTNCKELAQKRKLISNIYYVRDDGNGKSTLMRAKLEGTGTAATYVSEPLIEGIEGFRAEIGVDNLSETGETTNYAQAVSWSNSTTRTQASNRGDGSPDKYCDSSSTNACSAADLTNAVRVNLFVLAKTTEKMIANTDNKTYCLATLDMSGNCPTGYTFTADSSDEQRFSRHIFSTSIRLKNISGRRDTP